MLTLCCVCHKVIKPGPELLPSHGYCDKCMRSELEDSGCTQEEISRVVMDVNLRRWERIWKR
jgi:hypothetical protein